MINIYVTHHVTEALDGINDILVDQLYRMLEILPKSEHVKIHVVYWTNTQKYTDDLRRRTPGGIELVFNDRPGRADTQPGLRNKILDHARGAGCEAFMLLHNDVRVPRGFFEHLIGDWRRAEKKWGLSKAIVSPRYIPYHMTKPRPEAISNEPYWTNLQANVCVKSSDEMRSWCRPWDLSFSDDGEVICPDQSSTTDDGHQLMMFIAGPHFFDDVGPCDENFSGMNYDDCDWGMRALMRGKRNLQSTGALLGHISSLSFGPLVRTSAWLAKAADNGKIFVAKWGQDLFDEMQTGQLWRRLHRDQGDR
jgi:hypothetical protein